MLKFGATVSKDSQLLDISPHADSADFADEAMLLRGNLILSRRLWARTLAYTRKLVDYADVRDEAML